MVTTHPLLCSNIPESDIEANSDINTKEINVCNAAGINSIKYSASKAVAFSTAVFTAHNPKALEMLRNQRNISVMVDDGAQRSLITRAAVERLGLEIIGKERACIKGFNSRRPTNGVLTSQQ